MHNILSGYQSKSSFPHNYVRSRLAVLPEEQMTTLTRTRTRRNESMEDLLSRNRDSSLMSRHRIRNDSLDDLLDSGPQSMSYDVNPVSSTLRRKRSQSLADLQMSFNGNEISTKYLQLNIFSLQLPQSTLSTLENSPNLNPRRAAMILTQPEKADLHQEDL